MGCSELPNATADPARGRAANASAVAAAALAARSGGSEHCAAAFSMPTAALVDALVGDAPVVTSPRSAFGFQNGRNRYAGPAILVATRHSPAACAVAVDTLNPTCYATCEPAASVIVIEWVIKFWRAMLGDGEDAARDTGAAGGCDDAPYGIDPAGGAEPLFEFSSVLGGYVSRVRIGRADEHTLLDFGYWGLGGELAHCHLDVLQVTKCSQIERARASVFFDRNV